MGDFDANKKFIYSLFVKFPKAMNNSFVAIVNDVLGITDKDAEDGMIDDLIKLTKFDEIKDTEIGDEVISFIKKRGDQKFAEKLNFTTDADTENQPKAKTSETKDPLRYFWLNSRVKADVMDSTDHNLQWLQQRMDDLSNNQKYLNSNQSFVGFAETNNNILRDFKKRGAAGLRVFFALMKNKKDIVFIGNGNVKSTTEASKKALKHFTDVAKAIITKDSVDELEQVGKICESTDFIPEDDEL